MSGAGRIFTRAYPNEQRNLRLPTVNSGGLVRSATENQSGVAGVVAGKVSATSKEERGQAIHRKMEK
jgi:hypothetical protein